MPNDKELTPEELVEKSAEAMFDEIFPEFRGDMNHPLSKSLKKDCVNDATLVVGVILSAIERGEIVESFVDYDGQITTELKPSFKKWLEERNT